MITVYVNAPNVMIMLHELSVFVSVSPDVFPQQIEGVKMILNKTLSSFFKVSLPPTFIYIQSICGI